MVEENIRDRTLEKDETSREIPYSPAFFIIFPMIYSLWGSYFRFREKMEAANDRKWMFSNASSDFFIHLCNGSNILLYNQGEVFQGNVSRNFPK